MKKIACFLVMMMTCILLPVQTAVARSAPVPKLERIASSLWQWTGVAVSHDGRIFVNYPTWNDHPAFKVAELQQGIAQAYPDKNANKQFICVQSVVIDDTDTLWVLDPAKLRGQPVAASGAKLFRIDLTTNKITKVYVFPIEIAKSQSYLNDVRIDTSRQFAYVTDSGLGGIIVLNLRTGTSWRALTDIQEVKANLNAIYFKSTGRMDHISQSNGIELSKDRETLYFASLGGDRLYSIPTAVLRNPSMSSTQRQSYIDILAAHSVPTDGMILHRGKLYMADLPGEGIWEFTIESRRGRTLPLMQPLRWADSFAKAPDNSLYFTTSQINYPLEQRTTYGLYRLVL